VGVKPTLRAVLKQPKLAGLVPILPDHAAYARKASLPAARLPRARRPGRDRPARAEQKNLRNRLDRAGFDETLTSDFDRYELVTFDRDRVRDLFDLTPGATRPESWRHSRSTSGRQESRTTRAS
jgi:hypothetical protein